MVEVKGKANIVVKILADSVSPQGIRLVTYELTYPRIIHSELMTHSMLVRNAASSRAIPFAKMVEQLQGHPVRFGEANKGMQDKGEDFEEIMYVPGSSDMSWSTCWPEDALGAWNTARDSAIKFAETFYKAGYHKQVYNRLTEPFQIMKTVLSCTEDANFFWLRKHGAADPTLAELAECMFEARNKSTPQLLLPGQWHLPYVHFNLQDCNYYIDDSADYVTLEQAIKVSCARTAAVSFRNEDYGLDKCLEVYDRLIGDERKHASAMQHQATPMEDSKWNDLFEQYTNDPCHPHLWQEGISHVDRDGQLWSAQFKGWIMFRKTIPGENYTGENV